MAGKSFVFEVYGPYVVPTHGESRVVTPQERSEFFRDCPFLRDRRGVYVFGIRAGGGILPVYVGKATGDYHQECFTADKANKYTLGLSDYDKGTPVLFFVALPHKRGPVNKKLIGDLEDFLIQNAKARNPDLLNKVGAGEADWGIGGVIRGGKGKPSFAARGFKAMMGFS